MNCQNGLINKYITCICNFAPSSFSLLLLMNKTTVVSLSLRSRPLVDKTMLRSLSLRSNLLLDKCLILNFDVFELISTSFKWLVLRSYGRYDLHALLIIPSAVSFENQKKNINFIHIRASIFWVIDQRTRNRGGSSRKALHFQYVAELFNVQADSIKSRSAQISPKF